MKHNERFQLDRLAFFSDAVFAIAITLLVIEIHVPEIESQTDAALVQGLLALIPKYIGFIVSFFVIGRFWLGHHRIFGHLARCDDTLIGRNLLFLMAIAFGPFPTALISSYAGARSAAIVYTGWLIIAGLLNRRITAYAAKTPELWTADTDDATFARYLRGAWSPILIGLLALICGLILPPLALLPLIGSPLILMALNRWYIDRA